MLGIKIATTTVYHPQGDRQTEWVNQKLEQYLWLFINQCQDDWMDLLPLVEFRYNNHVHLSTQHPSSLSPDDSCRWVLNQTSTCPG